GKTTAPIAFDASAQAVQEALEALDTIGTLNYLPVSATTSLRLTLGAELNPAPATQLGLDPAPVVLLSPPLRIDDITPVPLMAAAPVSSSILVNGRRLNFTVPSEPRHSIRLTAPSPLRPGLFGTLPGNATFTLIVDGDMMHPVNVVVTQAATLDNFG